MKVEKPPIIGYQIPLGHFCLGYGRNLPRDFRFKNHPGYQSRRSCYDDTDARLASGVCHGKGSTGGSSGWLSEGASNGGRISSERGFRCIQLGHQLVVLKVQPNFFD